MIKQSTRVGVHFTDPSVLRRNRYRNDADFREKAMRASRKSYRRVTNMELESCLMSLPFFESVATVLQVKLPCGRLEQYQTFSLSQTADVLQKIYQTLHRWTRTGMLPTPVLHAIVPAGKPYFVYHLDEVRAFIMIIGEHEKTMAYYRKSHKDVTERIEQRISEIRHSLGYY